MGERASTVSERQLLRALTHDGCPVCDHLRNHEAEFRFWFIAERYHQRELLDALTNSLGFCVDHGELLADSPRSRSPMTSAHEVVSRRTLSRFEAGEIDRTTWSSLATCPACASFERAGDRTVSFLGHGLETSAAEYGDPGIACFPHFRSLAATVSPSLFHTLLPVQRRQFHDVRKTVRSMRENPTTATDSSLPSELETALQLTVGHDIHPSALPPPDVDPNATRDPVGDFTALLDSGDGCPVCLEVSRAWQTWLAWLLHADCDGDRLHDVLPACREHVWGCVRYGDTDLAMAIADAASDPVASRLTRAMRLLDDDPESREDVSATLAHVDSLRRFVPRLRDDGTTRAREAIRRPIRCPVCDRMETARDRAVELLLALLEQPRFRQAFEDGYGLCLNHCSYALARNPSPESAALLRSDEAAKVARLQWELREAQRKQAWDVRPEGKGAEQRAWLRAIARFSGRYTPLPPDDAPSGER
ncbi:hypothetical protein NKF26_19460 [Haladaptatus sp. AB618]|uniref:hypothetical protein n=1 Tax=Haladaptatus sp. AB618 TaxID=2934173 RepID=UPI00209BE75A|nr:hypothetical protein [Haladaptatus sp. AB618]MCO8255990.1 hypothetical protein [Haladaptatus sp. AB618]